MASASPITGAPAGAPLLDISALSLNGMTPFMGGPEIREDALRGAHALLLLLSQAFEDAHTIYLKVRDNEGSQVDTTNSRIKADALHGISTLVALAQYGSDLAVLEGRA